MSVKTTRHNESANEAPHNTRRTFCTALMCTSAGLVLGSGTLTKVLAAQDAVVVFPPIRIEGAETLLPGSALYFEYPTRNDPAVITRSSDGEFRAYSRRCSHAGCSIDFDAAGRCFKCPCHQGTFNAQAWQVMFGPPRRPLDEIILQVRAGGHVWAVGKSFGKQTEVVKVLGGGD